MLYKELIPIVGDIIKKDYLSLQINAPILDALKLLYTENISFIPILNEDIFMGTISINEVSAYLAQQSSIGRPIYRFRTENISKVLPGRFIYQGQSTEFEAPVLAGAMPFIVYLNWSQSFTEKPILVVGNRQKILEHALSNQLPAIIVTGVNSPDELEVDFSQYSGSIYLSDSDSAESIRLLRMSIPVNTVMNREHPRVQKTESFEAVKRLLMDSEFRGLPVFDNESFAGIVTRRLFVEKPVKEVILVDHNEIHQSVPGGREARVVEILDHHRLGAEKTSTPIYIVAKPVGSTSTIVYEHYIARHEEIPRNIAIILQAGIISDTVNRKSPTTTEEDLKALQELSKISGLNNDAYALEIFSQLKALKERDPIDIIASDFKTYCQFGLDIGIGQVEVINLREAEEMTALFSKALDRVAQDRALNWTLLLITDVIKQNSILVSSNFPQGLKSLIYQELNFNSFDLPNILSRKKQLLPEILRVAEEL